MILLRLVQGLLAAALLPAPERDRLAFRLGLPLAGWAVALSGMGTMAGGIAWALGWLRWMEAVTAGASTAALSGPPDATVGGLMLLGPLQALAYVFTPMGGSLGYVTLSGLARSGVWAATREVPGDPLVALVLGAAGALRQLRARRRAGALFGALPADSVRWTGESTLEIVCARRRPDLSAGACVEVDGRFYEVVSVGAAELGARAVVVHRLRELPPENVLRGFVRYR